jgi:[NiFe] hydrogenase diaphorase moiety small subunit
MSQSFQIDGEEIPFAPGQTIMQAAKAAGVYIPHLCWHPDFPAHGSCKLCTVKVNGRLGSACTIEAQPGAEVENRTAEIDDKRRTLLQMLFVEGNHFCPSCEKSGNCVLQATAYDTEDDVAALRHVLSRPPGGCLASGRRCSTSTAASCASLCVRASRDLDGKDVFAISGRGIASKLVIESPTGRLGDSRFSATDRAAHVCPVGAILPKRGGYRRAHRPAPLRRAPISTVGDVAANECRTTP